MYSRTKLCNVLIARELQHRYGADGLDAFSVSPGTVVTEVTRDLGAAGGIMAFCKSFWDKCGYVGIRRCFVFVFWRWHGLHAFTV